MAEDRAIKIVVVGDEACGKTSLLKIYCKNEYYEEYIPTILDNYEVCVERGDKRYKLSIYDTSGNEDLARLRPLTYDKADIVLICFSIVTYDNLESYVEKWRNKVKLYCPNASLILVGCKVDLRHNAATSDEFLHGDRQVEHGRNIAALFKLNGYIECSAKLNQGINEIFDIAVKSAVESHLKNNDFRDNIQEYYTTKEYHYPFQEELESVIWEKKISSNKLPNVCDHCFETSEKVVELTKRMDLMTKRISSLENRIENIEKKSDVKNINSVENCLTDFSSGLTMNSLNKISDTLTSLERLNLPDFDKMTAAPDFGKITAISDYKIYDVPELDNTPNSQLNGSASMKIGNFPMKRSINTIISNNMVKKVLDNQSQLSSLICMGLEENANQNDLRIIKNFAFQLRLSPNIVLSCCRLDLPYSLKNPRYLKIRFVSPEAAIEFLNAPKAAICCSQLKYKNISFSRPMSNEQEKEADELLSSIKHFTKK